ncbi:hypothetical protein EDB89DRAFT_1851971 [Lactarius sanguifluus]|nr:hypothetical protein EDB89DRAFT_1851971 [Lactarius sanguifluus]
MSPRAQSARGRVTKRKSSRQNSKPLKKNVAPPPSDTVSGPDDADDGESDSYLVEDDDFDEKSLHSDALDDDSDPELKPSGKRKRPTPVKPRGVKGHTPKRRKRAHSDDDEEEGDHDLKEGQELVGKVVRAPKTGKVPPGQISQNSFDFLSQLKKPECNDREWFRLHEPVFRLAETEFKLFIEKLTDLFITVDPQIPPLPPKDVIYRIYRDVRFSNDKTPYKTNFSATFSRSGRKGIFAGFKPGGESLLAAGTWCPGKNELATIRSHIQHNSSRLRQIINAPLFVKNFGLAKPSKGKGGRQNIFGRDDELKTAPKGIAKDHKEIDLLKCRSFVVVHQFTDEEVLSPNFGQTVIEVVKAAKPLVYCMNDYMSVGGGDEEEEAAGSDAEDGDQEQADEVSG